MRASRRLPLEALLPYWLEVPHPGNLPPDSPLLACAPSLDWSAVFGNDRPVEIEVGFGKGLFLLQQAAARPKVNFLGIEIERKYALFTTTRVAERTLPNVKIACTDARWFFKERVRESSVAAIHVYFPDPWWKTRHKKRKVFTLEFAQRCAAVLQLGGQLHFATDVADYYAESIELLRGIPALRGGIELPPLGEGEYLTNFERKYRQEGRAIHRTVYDKV